MLLNTQILILELHEFEKNVNTFTEVSWFLADERFDVGSFGCDETFIGDETLKDETLAEETLSEETQNL